MQITNSSVYMEGTNIDNVILSSGNLFRLISIRKFELLNTTVLNFRYTLEGDGSLLKLLDSKDCTIKNVSVIDSGEIIDAQRISGTQSDSMNLENVTYTNRYDM